MKRRLIALLTACALAGPANAQSQRFDWDAIGVEFCKRALAGDVAGLGPLLTPSLRGAIETAVARATTDVPATYLLQSYSNPAPRCAPSTRNAALIEIERSGPGGIQPSWREYLVVVPLADGSTRIDDMLFATRRSDTLRERLRRLGGG